MKNYCIIFFILVQIILLNSCKHDSLNGIYKINFHDSIALKIKDNQYRICTYKTHSLQKSDIVETVESINSKGSFLITKDKLILFDSIENKKLQFTIINSELLICNCNILSFKLQDSLYCKVKFYSNGYSKWEERPYNENLNVRIYYTEKGVSIKQIFFDRNRKIIRQERTNKYMSFPLWP